MTMSHVLTVEDIDMSKVKIKKPFGTSTGKLVCNVHYDSKPFILQTPPGHMPYSYSLYDNQRLQIDIDIQQPKFIEIMNNICAHLVSKLNRFDATLINGKQIVTPVKHTKNCIRLHCSHVSQCRIFDSNRNHSPITSLRAYDKIVSIFSIDRIVIDASIVLLHTQVHQIKTLDYSIHDVFHFEATVYDKMLKLGVSLDAVKHKMKLDGICDSIIETYAPQPKASNVTVNTPRQTPLPPPPPPPPPPQLPPQRQNPKSPHTIQRHQTTNMQALFKDISNKNFQLRKVDTQSAPQSQVVSSNSSTNKSWLPSGYKVPSLQDILKTKSSLKKVNK